ncbi:hypothetical protein BN2475_1250027 [Paraburkholderia ribeironis]|uniref:FecR protein domain-containing protein n=1 Tax=Paraburkholderia ribeironis TaxID=1247936 RepID=A0A1N7SP19_9BURK|nr:hypothetical protein BN2475_1250027 [Paraburkholderia ribeironis]
MPPPPASRAYVGTLEVYGPSAFLNGSPVASGANAYSGDNVSTGPGTSVIVHLSGSDFIQLNENTDPTFLEEASCLLTKIFSGEVFVHSHNTCVETDQVLAAMGSDVNVAHRPGRTVLTVIEGRVVIRKPQYLVLAPSQQYLVVRGVGQLTTLTPMDAAATAAWRQRYFRFRGAVPSLPSSPSSPPPPSPRPQAAQGVIPVVPPQAFAWSPR